jgi:hypothetical protein
MEIVLILFPVVLLLLQAWYLAALPPPLAALQI